MAAALRLLRTPERMQEAPAPTRGSRSGTYAITIPREPRRVANEHDMLEARRDEEPVAPDEWFLRIFD